jgi:hypothetical protein
MTDTSFEEDFLWISFCLRPAFVFQICGWGIPLCGMSLFYTRKYSGSQCPRFISLKAGFDCLRHDTPAMSLGASSSQAAYDPLAAPLLLEGAT